MSLSDILEHILSQAETDAKQLETEAKVRLESALKELEAKHKIELEAQKSQFKKKEDSLYQQLEAAMRQEKKALLDDQKRTILESYIQALIDKVHQDPTGTQAREIFAALLSEIPADATLEVPAGQKSFWAEISNHPTKENTELKAGFIAQVGQASYDGQWETLIHSQWKLDLEAYLADRLQLLDA